MQPFEMFPGPRILFGPNSVDRLGELAVELGGRRVLLVSDPGIVAAGHVDRAAAALKEAGLSVTVFHDVEPNPTTRHVEVGTAAARRARIDLIVGLGGGSAMDCGRGINFLVSNGGRMADYRGRGKARRPMLPMIGVPTTAGTGSEVQSFALIADEQTHEKMACGDRKAACRVVVLDPTLTLTQPAAVTAATGLDAIAHALESYVSTRRTPFSQMFARQAWRTLYLNYPGVIGEPADPNGGAGMPAVQNLDARAGMQIGAAMAGLAIENSMLGAAHSCANPLTARYGVRHGAAVGVMLPHVIRFNGPAAGGSYAELLAATCDTYPDHRDAACELANIVEILRRAGGLPESLEQLEVERSALPELAAEAEGQWTARFNPRPISRADLLALYQQAYSISQVNRSR